MQIRAQFFTISCLIISSSCAYSLDLYTGIEGGVNYQSLQHALSNNNNLQFLNNKIKTTDTNMNAGIYTGIAQGLGIMKIGVELNALGFNGTSTTSFTANNVTLQNHNKLDYSLGISVLPQFTIVPKVSLFLRGGLLYGHFTGSSTVNDTPSGSYEKNATGYVAGLGANINLTDSWSIRGEYNYNWYNKFSTATTEETGIGVLSGNFKPTDSRVLLGLTYHIV